MDSQEVPKDIEEKELEKRKLDPFADDESNDLQAASRESIRSFWICISGLAVMLQTAIFIGMYFCDRSIDWRLEQIFSRELAPCLVLVTVVPILFWRGGLTHRHAIAIAIVIAAMNSSVLSSFRRQLLYYCLQSYFALAACWLIVPVLLLCTPIRTEKLRLIVASCMLVIIVCVSFITSQRLRFGDDLLHWLVLFGSAIAFAILFRDWGKIAFLEADTTEQQIENTSIRTMMEMMVICGLACATSLYLSQSVPTENILLAVLLSGAVTRTSMKLLGGTFLWSFIPRLLVSWFVLTILIVANYRPEVFLQRNPSIRWEEFCFFGLAVVPLLVYCLCVSFWLRWCGWRLSGQLKLRGR